MCGITGWVSFDRDLTRHQADLDAMIDELILPIGEQSNRVDERDEKASNRHACVPSGARGDVVDPARALHRGGNVVKNESSARRHVRMLPAVELEIHRFPVTRRGLGSLAASHGRVEPLIRLRSLCRSGSLTDARRIPLLGALINDISRVA
jgi:hypothetical protein